MPRGDKSKYTDKQERKAEHIEESYESRGVSEDEAERRAWATVNKQDGGGKRGGSGAKRGAAKKSSSGSSKRAAKGGAKKSGAKKSCVEELVRRGQQARGFGAQEQLGPEELGQVFGQVLGPRHEVRRIEARDGREEERRQVAHGGEALLDDRAQIVEGIGPQERGEVEPQELTALNRERGRAAGRALFRLRSSDHVLAGDGAAIHLVFEPGDGRAAEMPGEP